MNACDSCKVVQLRDHRCHLNVHVFAHIPIQMEVLKLFTTTCCMLAIHEEIIP